VYRFERVGDLLREAQRVVDRQRALLDAIGERRPFDQFITRAVATCDRSRP